jgi:organic hydroperoxide reductase OsmC/OhrA
MSNVRIKKQFTYKTYLKWKEERKGILSSDDKSDIEVATPPEFRGHHGIWTPEELFIGSVNICIMTTFLYYAEKEGLKFLSYESYAEGILERGEQGLLFTRVMITPKILVSLEEEVETVKSLMVLSEKNCFISNSLKSEILLTPQIEVKGDDN